MLRSLPPEHCNITAEWWGIDSEENYTINIKKSVDWSYKDIQIKYTTNSDGYRTLDWASVQWEDSVVVIGCSMVFGQGLAEEHTLCNQLSKLINKPCINLGVCGSSNSLIFYNSLKLIENNIKPYAVVLLLAGNSRITHFNQDTTDMVQMGPWTLPTNPLQSLLPAKFRTSSMTDINFYAHYIANGNSDVHGHLMAVGAESLWKANGVRVISYSDSKQLPNITDRARDCLHPGIQTMKSWAEVIKKDLDL